MPTATHSPLTCVSVGMFFDLMIDMASTLLGILSDTHGVLPNARAGLALLKSLGVGQFIHAGDVGEESTFDIFAGEAFSFVWGNNDVDRVRLKRYAESLSFNCLDEGGTIDVAGRKLAVTHGDNAQLLTRFLADQSCDYVIVGHTHVRRDDRIGMTRLINPGALHRARIKTVATLDLVSENLSWFDIATQEKVG